MSSQVRAEETSCHPCHDATIPAEASLPISSQRYYRPELDWLRFGAFSLVFAHHVAPLEAVGHIAAGVPASLTHYVLVPLIRAGSHGVDLFFVLSAYLITELLLRERAKAGTVNIKAFYIRRLLRIWPLYFLIVILTFPYELLMTDNPTIYYAMHLVFIGNWYAVFWGGVPSVTGHLWSIQIEEQFYLFWPVLMCFLKQRHFVWFLLALYFFSTFDRSFQIGFQMANPDAIHHGTLMRMDCFAVGGLLACFLHSRPVTLTFAARAVLFALGVLSFCFIAMIFGDFFDISEIWRFTIATLGSAITLASFVTVPQGRTYPRAFDFISYLGKISYGLYMWHVPVILVVSRSLSATGLGPGSKLAGTILLSAALTLALSATSYALLESPFLRLKERFTLIQSRPV